MISRADVVIIGFGGLGAATAFYLVTRGVRNVTVVDKHETGSQTSPRAAGMVSCGRPPPPPAVETRRWLLCSLAIPDLLEASCKLCVGRFPSFCARTRGA